MRVPRNAVSAAAAFLSAIVLLAPGCASSPPPDTVYVADGPPAMQTEVVSVSPGAGFVWVPGWWNYDRTYVWVGGVWQRPPRAGAVWVTPVWRRSSRGWYLTRGRWR